MRKLTHLLTDRFNGDVGVGFDDDFIVYMGDDFVFPAVAHGVHEQIS